MGVRAALAMLAVSAAAHADPVAFVADIHGNATIEGDGQLQFLAELTSGTRLLLGTHASAAIVFAASGAEFTVNGPGRFTVRAAEVDAEAGATPTRRAVPTLGNRAIVSRASQTATASLRMRGVAPPAPESTLEYPVATRVTTLRPEMRWRASPGESYTLALLDASGREVWSGPAVSGRASGVALQPGTRYSWRVAAGSRLLGEGDFETLTAGAIARAEQSRAAARTFSDRVRLALLLEDLGAGQESRDLWTRLAGERPDLPGLAALAR